MTVQSESMQVTGRSDCPIKEHARIMDLTWQSVWDQVRHYQYQ